MKPVKKFTEMQTAYIEARAAGVKRREAAIHAGYSAATADQQAYAMENREDIRRAVAAAKKRLKSHAKSLGVNLPKEEDEDIPDRNKMPKATYSDAKEFLLDAMNHPMLPIAVRGDYAKALLPYQHGRVGETGKKLHTARSRNDQVALDLRLTLKKEIVELVSLTKALIETIATIAEAHAETVMVVRLVGALITFLVTVHRAEPMT